MFLNVIFKRLWIQYNVCPHGHYTPRHDGKTHQCTISVHVCSHEHYTPKHTIIIHISQWLGVTLFFLPLAALAASLKLAAATVGWIIVKMYRKRWLHKLCLLPASVGTLVILSTYSVSKYVWTTVLANIFFQNYRGLFSFFMLMVVCNASYKQSKLIYLVHTKVRYVTENTFGMQRQVRAGITCFIATWTWNL